jgi:uroporphyrinogen decarboxylase
MPGALLEQRMITSKERFQRILNHQPVDRIGLFEVFWRETARKWADGRFEKPEMISDHFGLDVRRTGYEITPVLWTIINLVADLDAGEQIIEETETTKLVRNGNGAVLRWGKDRGSAPEHVSFLVKDRKTWEDHIRPHLVNPDNYRRRLALDLYRDMRADCARKNVFLTTAVLGAFDAMNALCGHECVLTGMATDPDWIKDMCNVYAAVTVDMLEMAYQEVGLPDGLWCWDDLGFKRRPFMSPAMYREIVFPAHKKLFDFAHGKGLPVVLHCDGLVESLVPSLIDAGVNCLQPLEVKAGMDLLKIKKAFGERLALIGGMDVRTLLTNDLDVVRRELESKVPAVMAGGGYVLQIDHSVPDQVDYDTYRYFIEKGLALGTYK